jgi:hypothetical protein
MTNQQPKDKKDKDFEFQAKIPGVGELTLKLSQDSWTSLVQITQKPCIWIMATVLSGTIGAHILGRSTPPAPKLPGGEVPAQTK